MKRTVITIVRNIGRPPDIKDGIFKYLTSKQNKIIDAILNGADTRDKIAKELNINKTNLAQYLQEIYKITSLQGVEYKTKVKKLDELIKFIENYKEKNRNAR